MACRAARLTAKVLIAGFLAVFSTGAGVAAQCQCTTETEVVCGEDGNSYQNACLTTCQGVAVAAQGPCTVASNVGAKMAQAFAAATASDSSIAAAMSVHGLSFTPQQLNHIAAAAAGVVQGFGSDATRVVTAADMARLERQGMVLVGVLKSVNGFNPTAPPVPDDAVDRPSEPYENFGATEAAMTADGLLFKPKLLAKHAAIVAIAAAKTAAETAAAMATPPQQPDSAPTQDQASMQGIVRLQSFQPPDLMRNDTSAGRDGPGGTAGDSGGEEGEPEDSAGGGSGMSNDPRSADSHSDEQEQDSDGNKSGLIQSEVGVLAAAGGRIVPPLQAVQSLGRRHLSKVYSPDDRVELTNRQKSLIRAVGRITYGLEDSSYFCSGAVIGRFTVLTAAHCVLSITEPGVTATSWKFAAGFNKWGDDPRYGRVAASHFLFDTRFWNKDSWWLWDLAVVVLEKSVGVKTGYFGVGFKPRGYHGPLYTAGYPGDKPLWSFWVINSNTSCVVADNNGLDTIMSHKCDTYPGQSGSPMWIPGTNTILSVVSWEQADTNGACAVNAFWYRFVRSHRPDWPIPKSKRNSTAAVGH